MTHYRFWSGLDTIGGNIVEVYTEQARVICDFGSSVPSGGAEDRFEGTELEHVLLRKELPAIPGLYDTSSFQTLDLMGYEESTAETAIFISHLHLDHMGGLKHLPEDTPVYLSVDSYWLYQALIEAGDETAAAADVRFFDFGEIIHVGDISVQPKRSDHDIEGTSAFFVETADLKLIHSGDLRLTGDYPERVHKWIREAKEWQPDVLLLEGTTFSFEESEKETGPSSEAALRQQLRELLQKETDQIIFFNPYIRNVDRMKQAAATVEAAGRTMVFEPAYASVLHALHPDERCTVLSEKELPFAKQTVTLEDIQSRPGSYVLQNSHQNLEWTAAFGRGIYCHSNGEPLGDYDPRHQEMMELLLQNNFEFINLGTSGHAEKDELIETAKCVQAKVTVPWHTFRPDVFHGALQEAGIPAMLPELDTIYTAEGQKDPRKPVLQTSSSKEEQDEADHFGNK